MKKKEVKQAIAFAAGTAIGATIGILLASDKGKSICKKISEAVKGKFECKKEKHPETSGEEA